MKNGGSTIESTQLASCKDRKKKSGHPSLEHGSVTSRSIKNRIELPAQVQVGVFGDMVSLHLFRASGLESCIRPPVPVMDYVTGLCSSGVTGHNR